MSSNENESSSNNSITVGDHHDTAENLISADDSSVAPVASTSSLSPTDTTESAGNKDHPSNDRRDGSGSSSSSSPPNFIVKIPPVMPPPPPPKNAVETASPSFYTNFQEGCHYIMQQKQQNDTATTTTTTATVNDDAQQQQSTPSLQNDVVPPSSVLPTFLSTVTVNFVDPTTSSIMMSGGGTTITTTVSTAIGSSSSSSSALATSKFTKASSTIGYSAAVKRAKLNQSIQLYEKFQTIFKTQYHNQLDQVPYCLFRNQMMTGKINQLPIRSVVTRGHGGFLSSSYEDDRSMYHNTSNSSSSSNIKVHGDFSWEQPYCHVYLAACEGLDHYRTKVKPSIQVFINQLEAEIKAAAAASSSSSSASTMNLFRRSRSNPNQTNTSNDTNTNTSNDTSLEESITNNNNTGLDISTKAKKNKRIPPAPRYVIIYIPTGQNHTTTPGDHHMYENSSSPIKGGSSNSTKSTLGSTVATTNATSTTATIGASVVSRFAAARQRMASAVVVGRNSTVETTSGGDTNVPHVITSSTNTTSAATTGTDTVTSIVTDDEAILDGSQQQQQSVPQSIVPPAIQQLNRIEREIARRFANDFPAGNVCTLSTLFDAATVATEVDHSNINTLPTTIPENGVQQLEWQAVLKAMGNAIMANFHDRCQRYDDELRSMDQKRRGVPDHMNDTSTTTTTTTPTKQRLINENSEESNDVSSTTTDNDFHLCHFFLVKENLAFTYEQMRLPSEALLQYEELRAFLPDRIDTATGIKSVDGDRQSKKKLSNWDELSDLALRGHLLEFRRQLKMHGDVSTIQCVAEEYFFAREIALLFQMQKPLSVLQRCYTYLESTFTMKKVQVETMENTEESRQKLIDLFQWAFCYCWYIKAGSDSLFSNEPVKSPDSIACARCICDILEFARNCFESLGKLVLSQPGIVWSYGQDLTISLGCPWSPWKQPAVSDDGEKPIIESQTPQDVLKNALLSQDTYSEHYCAILDTIAACHEYGGRFRFAALLRIKRVDLLDAKGDKVLAAKEIQAILNLYKADQWNACYFALLIRLAGLQRITASPEEYLFTLLRCFYRGVKDIAPPKALAALHTDLLSVIRSSVVKGSKYAAPTLFFPTFSLEGMAKSALPGNDRTLLKKLYTVGDTIRVNLTLQSYLPNEIVADCVTISLVTFQTYVAAMEDNVSITDQDVHHSIKSYNVAVMSGATELRGEWQPIDSGQLIIASVCLTWCGVHFMYSAKDTRRPIIRIDVVPCSPSQNLAVTPQYLLTGQEQPIHIELSANNDCIVKGRLALAGPSNVLFRYLEPNSMSAEWVPSLDIPVQPCEPSQKIAVTAYAKVDAAEEVDDSKDCVRITMTTTYKYTNNETNAIAIETMQASLDETMEILNKAAFTVASSNLISYSIDRFVLNVVLTCNSSSVLIFKTWSLDLPSCYTSLLTGDINSLVKNERVKSGDQLSLTFDCGYDMTATNGSALAATLNINFDNEMGTSFHEMISLKLKSSMNPPSKRMDIKPLMVKISPSLKECLVGLPIEITYDIDCSELKAILGIVTYHIATEHADWIIHGKNSGVINPSLNDHMEVTVVAIPIRHGSIHEYPALSLTMSSSDTGTKSIPITSSLTEAFMSTAPSEHTSVAVLVGSDYLF
jgi:trafficking protein particle complex subunit 10